MAVRARSGIGVVAAIAIAGCSPPGDRRPQSQATPVTASPKPTSAARGPVGPPVSGAYLGAYPDAGGPSPDLTPGRIARFEDKSRRRLALVLFETPWDGPFPAQAVRTVSATGAVPIVQWEPWAAPYEEGAGPGRFPLASIADGRFDDYIRQWTSAAAGYADPLMVVFADEMNGDWFPWSANFNGGQDGPRRFVAAWRRIVGIARSEGASNITWVWQPNGVSAPEASWNAPARWYPGEDYADWLGVSAYGRQERDEPWQTFTEVMDPIYSMLAGVDTGKPWVVAEWAVTEDARKPDWIDEGLRGLQDRYPRIRAAVWWDEAFDGLHGRIDLRIDSSLSSRDAYRSGVAGSYWVDRPSTTNR
jgi:hypothetical protein